MIRRLLNRIDPRTRAYWVAYLWGTVSTLIVWGLV